MTNSNTVTVPIKLLPCPFCGVTPLMRRHRNWGCFVECANNGCVIPVTTRLRGTPAEAAADWNRRAAPTPPVGQGEWLPIETAPKDGKLFLGWVRAVRYGEDDAGQPFEHDVSDHDFCRWREMETGGFYENMMGQIGDAQDITHWMPLPAAPSSEGGE